MCRISKLCRAMMFMAITKREAVGPSFQTHHPNSRVEVPKTRNPEPEKKQTLNESLGSESLGLRV